MLQTSDSAPKTSTANGGVARLQYIDALRGISILGVIASHASSITHTGGPLAALAGAAGNGVYLFFVISAFTIFLTLTKQEKRERFYVSNFFVRRLFRIIPVYWLGIIIYTAVFGLGSRGWLPGPEWWHYPFHLTLTNLLHPETQSSVVPGGWSISCEVLFYLTVPLWFHFIKNIPRAYLFALVSTLIFPMATFACKALLNHQFQGLDERLLEMYWSRFPTSQLGCFAFGILGFYLLQQPDFTRLLKDRWINAATLASVLFLVLVISRAQLLLPLKIHVYCLLFMFGLSALAVHPWGLFVNRFTVFMGTISYSAYLFHFLALKGLVVFIAGFCPRLTEIQSAYFVVVVTVGTLITIGMAYCGFMGIEKPAIGLSKRIIKSREMAV